MIQAESQSTSQSDELQTLISNAIEAKAFESMCERALPDDHPDRKRAVDKMLAADRTLLDYTPTSLRDLAGQVRNR